MDYSHEELNGRGGIYGFFLRGSDRCYIGSSVNLGLRRRQHQDAVRNGRPGYFYKSVRELGGMEAFDYEVLAFTSKDEMLEREKFFIAWYDSANAGFNTHSDPTKPFGGLMTERARQESAKLTSARNRQWKRSEATKAKMSESQRRRFLTAEARLKMANIRSQAKVTDETRAKLSEAHKRLWRDPVFLARPRKTGYYKPPADPEAFKAKLKLAWIERRKRGVSEETRRKLSEAQIRRNARLREELAKTISAAVSPPPILSSEPKQV